MTEASWDYIIAGAGSAGATLAARLSADPSHRVLLLEAGGRDSSPFIHIPGFLGNALMSKTLNWHYLGEPDSSLGGRRLTWAGGRVLGGSSSINGMVYGRGLPADYDGWAAEGNAGWGWSDLLPHFRDLETWSGTPHATRGTAGALQVRPFLEPHPACMAVLDGFVAAGVPRVDDYSVGIEHGIGITQATQRGGWRHSAAMAFLTPARGRSNLTVLTHSHAHRLLLENGRCVGVEYERHGQLHSARAEREVVVCTGAIATPKLLQLSGIGPEALLRQHGITVRHHLPGVGQNLNDHVNVKLSAHTSVPTYNSARFGLGKALNGMRWLVDRRGPASSPANHGQGFIKTRPGLASADVQVQLMAFAFNDDPLSKRDGISTIVSLCRPEVRGSVGLSAADPKAAPRIDIRMLDSDRDIAALMAGAKIARDVMLASAVKYNNDVFAPKPAVRSDADWLAFFRQNAGLNWHPTSTCRMGSGALDVVGADLRVHGIEGLSIADASVMPTVTSANTNVPVIVIADKAAGLILARTR